MEDKRQRQQYLEEQYYEEKRKIQRKQETLNEQLMYFRNETRKLIEKVTYLTKDDTWDKQEFYQAMEQSDQVVRQAGNRYAKQLEEKERELAKNYQTSMTLYNQKRSEATHKVEGDNIEKRMS